MPSDGDSGARHASPWHQGTVISTRSESPDRDGAVSPPAPLPEGPNVGHLMGHLSSADPPVRNGFIWYVAVSMFGCY